jgi:aminomethyltransferase
MVKRTALYERHLALGGRMVEFAGYELPVQYPTGPRAEHMACRQAAGLFDIDHMGQVVVSGRDALSYLQSVMTADVSRFAHGSAHYSLMCYGDGGVVDDTFIYTLPGRYFVVINASNNAKDTRWLEAHRDSYEVQITNVSEGTYMLALQGPQSQAILQPLCSANLKDLPYHQSVETTVLGQPTLVGHTGYTGEDGYELYFPQEAATTIWDSLLEQGIPFGLVPVGLAARDSLRFEACMPLYGDEITATRNPIGSGLGWAVSFTKGDFEGRDALLKEKLEGSNQRLVGLRMVNHGVPRHGYPVLVKGQVCGVVTSGMYAPTLDEFLAMAYVSSEYYALGTELAIDIRGKPHKAVVVNRPFYTPAYRR